MTVRPQKGHSVNFLPRDYTVVDIETNGVISIGQYSLWDCYSLTNIYFNGTMEQWNMIEKGISWDANTGKYTIHCTNGDITKS